jgi:hypothetical protein
MKEFYIYQLRAENEILPFYIGKGFGNRLERHTLDFELKKVNYKTSKIKSLKSRGINVISEKLYISNCEESCFEMECFLIKLYGRKNNKTGILTNLTDGGEGPSGFVCTPEIMKNRIQNKKGIKRSESWKNKQKVNNKNRNRVCSDKEIMDYCKQWKESGLHKKVFAEQNNLSYNTFRKWAQDSPYRNEVVIPLEEKLLHINNLIKSGLSIRKYCINNYTNYSIKQITTWKKQLTKLGLIN